MKECPFCSEEIKSTAKKCKHCGEILDPVLRASEERKQSSNTGPTVVLNDRQPDKKFPHLIHFILSLLTVGAWVVIWIIHYLVRDRSHYR